MSSSSSWSYLAPFVGPHSTRSIDTKPSGTADLIDKHSLGELCCDANDNGRLARVALWANTASQDIILSCLQLTTATIHLRPDEERSVARRLCRHIRDMIGQSMRPTIDHTRPDVSLSVALSAGFCSGPRTIHMIYGSCAHCSTSYKTYSQM